MTRPLNFSVVRKYILLSLWAILVLIPLWVMIINSFKMRLDVYQSPLLFPTRWQFDGYVDILFQSRFPRYFLNSLIITMLSIATVLFLSSLSAYALIHWRNFFTKIVTVFFLIGLMVPIRIGSINILRIMQFLGMQNTLLGLLPIYTAMGMPVAILVMSEFMRTIPRELTEAAKMDGAGRFRIYAQCILPMSRPAMATVAIFTFVTLWNDLWFPLILIQDDSQRTLMLGISKLFGQFQTDWTKIFVALTCASIPVIILYFSMSQHFIRGLTVGALKE